MDFIKVQLNNMTIDCNLGAEMSFKLFILLNFVFFIIGCESKIMTNMPNKNSENISSFNPFLMATHMTMGSCEELPITHRVLNFSPIILEQNGTDFYIGTLDVALFSETKTYEATYKEWPGPANSDNTLFETKLSGSYSFEKSQIKNAPDNLVLEKIGTIAPTLNVNKVRFILTLAAPINRELAQADVIGLTLMRSSSLFDDSCP